MRELILKRIEAIRKLENGFPIGVNKWDKFSDGTVKKHLSEVNFSALDDTELLFLFERLLRRWNQKDNYYQINCNLSKSNSYN